MPCLLDEFGLYQYVTFPTHVRGHTLDLVIGDNRHPQIIRNTRTLSHGSVESDHFPVCFNIMFKKPGKVKKIVHYRKWSSLDVKQFEDNIKENISHLDTLTEVNDLVSFYNDVLSSAVTTQLPLKRKTITEHPNCPYYNDTLRAEKQKRRSLERQWRRNVRPTKKHCSKLSMTLCTEVLLRVVFSPKLQVLKIEQLLKD